MITVYHRPEKRYVNDDDMEQKYSCLIRNESTSTHVCATVPSFFTVFSVQHNASKIQVHLVGSNHPPPLSKYGESVNRIEFYGHIGFEESAFDMMHQLKGLRKIGFFLSLTNQGKYVQKKRVTDSSGQTGQGLSTNRLVTSLKMVVDTKSSGVEDEAEPEQKKWSSSKETLRIMIICLLRRSVDQCCNIKRLTLDLPNWTGVRPVVDEIVDKLKHLKPTTIVLLNGRIVVRKTETSKPAPDANLKDVRILASNDDGEPIPTPVPLASTTPTNAENVESEKSDEPVHQTNVVKENENKSPDLPGESNVDETDAPPCLVDMSKLLGSMLGIPTSSNSATTQQQGTLSLPLISTIPLSNNPSTLGRNVSLAHHHHLKDSTDSINYANTSNQKQSVIVSSSSPSTPDAVAISYAAAAAAATTLPANNGQRNLRAPVLGNGSHPQRREPNNNNEGSRRTFLRDGEGSQNDDGATYQRKPSIPPYVADLGKPVFASRVRQNSKSVTG